MSLNSGLSVTSYGSHIDRQQVSRVNRLYLYCCHVVNNSQKSVSIKIDQSFSTIMLLFLLLWEQILHNKLLLNTIDNYHTTVTIIERYNSNKTIGGLTNQKIPSNLLEIHNLLELLSFTFFRERFSNQISFDVFKINLSFR